MIIESWQVIPCLGEISTHVVIHFHRIIFCMIFVSVSLHFSPISRTNRRLTFIVKAVFLLTSVHILIFHEFLSLFVESREIYVN